MPRAGCCLAATAFCLACFCFAYGHFAADAGLPADHAGGATDADSISDKTVTELATSLIIFPDPDAGHTAFRPPRVGNWAGVGAIIWQGSAHVRQFRPEAAQCVAGQCRPHG